MLDQQFITTCLVYLLRIAWVAAILPILISSIPSHKLHNFHHLLLGFARRGKILQSHSKKFTVPQKYFWHFYVVAVIWTTFLLVATWQYAYKIRAMVTEPLRYSNVASHVFGVSVDVSLHKSQQELVEYNNRIWRSVVLLLLMEAQVLRRLFESVYVFKYSPTARMHILAYLTGYFFYIAAPLSLCCKDVVEVFKFVTDLVAEVIVKGKDRMLVQEYDIWGHVHPLLQLKWYLWVGAATFLWGWYHQRNCHLILGSLRENGEKVDDYAIPYGDWFNYVSSPHYLAEIVIYGGLVIAGGCSDITLWLLFGFVVANLALAAAETQKWYLHKFDDYPRNRFAIFPFVY